MTYRQSHDQDEGKLKVTEIITGYEKRTLPGQGLIGVFDLDLPPQIFETIGFWIEIEPVIKRFVEEKGLHFMGGIHAIEHAAIGSIKKHVWWS